MDELIALELEIINLVEIFTGNGIEDVITKIEAEARSMVADVSTKDGQDEIRTMAANVARAKTRLDGLGKDLVSDWKSKAKVVDSSRRQMRERLDALKIEVRQPLTAFEEDEEARLSAERLAKEILSAWIEADQLDALFEREREIAEKEAMIAAEEAERKAKAEAEQAAKEQAERDERLKKEAAENAKREAEEKAAREKAETELKAAEAVAAAERAEREKIEAAQRAEQAKIDDAAKAEADKQAAIAEEQRKAKAEADQKERERIAKEKAEKDKADKLAANKAHRKAVDAEIVLAFANHGYNEDAIADLISVINSGDIPHMSIGY